jgi:hypothetical protein
MRHRARPGAAGRTDSARAFSDFLALASHIERLCTAYSLAEVKFFRHVRALPEFYSIAESFMV